MRKTKREVFGESEATPTDSCASRAKFELAHIKGRPRGSSAHRGEDHGEAHREARAGEDQMQQPVRRAQRQPVGLLPHRRRRRGANAKPRIPLVERQQAGVPPRVRAVRQPGGPAPAQERHRRPRRGAVPRRPGAHADPVALR